MVTKAASTTTNAVLENKVTTLENKLEGSEDVVKTLRNRVSQLSDELGLVKEDLNSTKTMIQQDLQTMMERISNRLKKT